MTKETVLVVGAGPLGLLTALELTKRGIPAKVVDAGPDPRVQSTHNFGATYSGRNARHRTINEYALWTYPKRAGLMFKSPAEGGWRAIAEADLSARERAWREEFLVATFDEAGTKLRARTVQRMNKAGMRMWDGLELEFPGFIKPVSGARKMLFVLNNEETMHSEFADDAEVDPGAALVTDPDSAYGLIGDKVRNGDLFAYEVTGSAYRIKDVCSGLVDVLGQRGVRFLWNTKVGVGAAEAGLSGPDKGFYSDPMLDEIHQSAGTIYCGGSSIGPNRYSRNDSPQGVVGCWIRIPNPGITSPFKYYPDNAEPANWYNFTNDGEFLDISAGFSWTGDMRLEAAVASGILDPMRSAVQQKAGVLLGNIDEIDKYPTSFCMRPAFANGVPRIEWKTLSDGTPVVINQGHAASGTVMAPAVAMAAVDQLVIGPEKSALVLQRL